MLRLDHNGRLEFPCRYPIKAMTRASAAIPEEILELLSEEGFDPEPKRLSIRPSRNGRFQAITVEVDVESRASLEAAYARLRALDGVVMML